MTYSGLVTRRSSTPNSNARSNGARPRYIVHHHMASTSFEGVLASWRSGAKQGSCHAAISNGGEVVGVVDESLRAWSLSSASFDSQALVTEIANSAVGGSWTVSAAATEAAARLTADWCRRYGIPCDRDHVIGHREVYTRFGKGYSTACPGGLDLDGIVRRAREILGQPGAPAPVNSSTAASAPAATTSGWNFWIPSRDMQARVQRALKARGRYAGPADGIWGPESVKGIQRTIAQAGLYSGPIDGVAGSATCAGVQAYAARFGSYDGPQDRDLGTNSWAGFALGLERP